MSKPVPNGDLEALANGVDYALKGMYGGKVIEFMLILAVPAGDTFTSLQTITGITDPEKLRIIGAHLIATANQQQGRLDPDGDDDVQGHA
jgi:hypothetical protein